MLAWVWGDFVHSLPLGGICPQQQPLGKPCGTVVQVFEHGDLTWLPVPSFFHQKWVHPLEGTINRGLIQVPSIPGIGVHQGRGGQWHDAKPWCVRPVHHLSPEFSTIIKCLFVIKQPKQTNWNQAFNEIALPENPLICIKQTNQSSTTSKDNESIFQSNESSKPMITTPLISNQTQQTMPLKHFIPSLINNHQLNHKQNHHQPKKHEPSMKTPVGRWSN